MNLRTLEQPSGGESNVKLRLLALTTVLALLLIRGQASGKTMPSGFHYPVGTGSPTILKQFGAPAANDGSEERWISGVRLKAGAGDAVYAVADGEVVKISPYGWGKGNSALIVKHTLSNGRRFIAVYGRVRHCQTGRVRAGQRIAVIGPGGYMHFGIFESLNGLGDLPYVRSQFDYAVPAFSRPLAETIDGILCYGRWFDPVYYLKRRWPRPFLVGQAVFRPGCPGQPVLIEPANGSFWNWMRPPRPLQFCLSAGSGPISTAFRIRVRRAAGGWWWTSWTDWTSGWVFGSDRVYFTPPVLIPGDYWWEAQARNDEGEGLWRVAQWHFHVNYPPGVPAPNSPAEGEAIAGRQVRLSWSDPGDPDDYPRHSREYRVRISGDWSYDSGWSVISTSLDVTVPRDGHFSWQVAASDGWDYSDFSARRRFTVDTEPPNITLTGPPAGRWTNQNTIGWNITDAVSGVATATIKWDSGPDVAVQNQAATPPSAGSA
ncbi:MAG: M23 family metallopeptidase [Armatimonadota bacterium]|nr:M23 family metallopeptidase [Armatimonadota bacterium]